MLIADPSAQNGDLNFAAFSEPVSHQSLQATRTGREDRAAWVALIYRGIIAAALLAAAIAWTVLFVSVFLEKVEAGQALAGVPFVVGGLALLALLLFLSGYIVVVALRLDVPRLGAAVRRVRLQRFAKDNPPMFFVPEIRAPAYPGIPFTSTIRPVAFDIIWAQFRLPVELGNLRFAGAREALRVGIVRGYLRIDMGRELPHMLLVSKRDRGNTAIPVVMRGDQTLSLEGEFNRHFTLYVPREYERDALYVFTPDLMALLIDYANEFDVEIIDSWMNIYSHAPLRMVDPATYSLARDLVERLGSKALRQTARYSDVRVPAAASTSSATRVAPQGRRLRTTVSIFVISATIGAAVVGAVLSYVMR